MTLMTYPNLLDLATRRGIQDKNTVFRSVRPFVENSNKLRSSENTITEIPPDLEAKLKKLESDEAMAAYMSSYIPQATIGARNGLDQYIGSSTPMDALYFSKIADIKNPKFNYIYGPLQTELRLPFDFSEGNAKDWFESYKNMPFRYKDTITKQGPPESGDVYNWYSRTMAADGEGAVVGLRGERALEPVRVRYNRKMKLAEDIEARNRDEYLLAKKEGKENEYLENFNNVTYPLILKSISETDFKNHPRWSVQKNEETIPYFVKEGKKPENIDEAYELQYWYDKHLQDLLKDKSNVETIPYSPFSFKFEDGGEYQLGDEVDEATMQKLKENGYTFEIVK
jgi:hypothetical protein